MNASTLQALIAGCRNAKTYDQQFSGIRDIVARVNTALRGVTHNMHPIAAATRDGPVNCYYEMTVDFLYNPPFRSQGKPLFLAPSPCNKIVVRLHLVDAGDPSERFEVGAYWQSLRDGALKVYALPRYYLAWGGDRRMFAVNDDAEPRDFYAVHPLQLSHAEYFTGKGIGALLFNVMVVMMACTKNRMVIDKFNVATDRLCVPYEVAREFRHEGADRHIEHIRQRQNAIAGRGLATKERFVLDFECDETDSVLQLYETIMADNVAKYVKRLQHAMSAETIPVNMICHTDQLR